MAAGKEKRTMKEGPRVPARHDAASNCWSAALGASEAGTRHGRPLRLAGQGQKNPEAGATLLPRGRKSDSFLAVARSMMVVILDAQDPLRVQGWWREKNK